MAKAMPRANPQPIWKMEANEVALLAANGSAPGAEAAALASVKQATEDIPAYTIA